jgi:hypothetical protein
LALWEFIFPCNTPSDFLKALQTLLFTVYLRFGRIRSGPLIRAHVSRSFSEGEFEQQASSFMATLLAAIFSALTLATSVYAKIGETPAQAEARWGKPALEKGPVSYYYTENWMILQAYDDQENAVISGYYNKKGITDDDARKLDLLNFPDIKVWNELPNIGGDSTKQWISDDGRASIVAGVVFKDGIKLDCRMYLTEKGTEIAHNQGLEDEPRIDIEKQTTN